MAADDLGGAHQPGDPLVATPDAGVGEFGVDPRRALDLPVVVVGGAALGVSTPSAAKDRAEGGRDNQASEPERLTCISRHTAAVVVGLLPVDEGHPRHLLDSVAKKAAARLTISARS